MSRYYKIKGLKIRVSDHEPNIKLNGSSDAYIYTQDVCGTPIPVMPQLERIAEKHDLPMSDFQKLMDDCIVYRWSANIVDSEGYDVETLKGVGSYVDLEQAKKEISKYLYQKIAESMDGADDFDLYVEEVNLLTLED